MRALPDPYSPENQVKCPHLTTLDDGSRRDRPRLDAAGGAAVSGTAVAAARGGVSQPWWWETATGGGLRWRRVPARPVSRASAGLRGLLGGHESPLV